MLKIFVAIGFLGLLGACSSGGGDEYSPYGGTEDPKSVRVGKPYTIKGVTYQPRYDPNYVETGVASWYGPNFNGRMTASGERFDEEEITAAHRTLPMPSMVRVTRLDTGQSLIVRVNDRGPFAHNRIIDLSKGSARALGMLNKGTARVKVEYLPKETEYYLASIGLSRPSWMVPSSPDAYYTSVIPEKKPGTPPTSVAPIPTSYQAPAYVPAPVQQHPVQQAQPQKRYILQQGYDHSPFSVVD